MSGGIGPQASGARDSSSEPMTFGDGGVVASTSLDVWGAMFLLHATHLRATRSATDARLRSAT